MKKKYVNCLGQLSVAVSMTFLFSPASGMQEAQIENVETLGVRPTSLPELDFEAKVLAFGIRSFTERVHVDGLVSGEFQDRLVELTAKAQKEWVERSGTSAMEQLMNFQSEADWKPDERNVFATFANRIAISICNSNIEPASTPKAADGRCLRAIDSAALSNLSVGLGDSSLIEVPSNLLEIWKRRFHEISLLREDISFQNFPDDVTAVLVNGVWYDRESLAIPIYKTTGTTFRNRVTLISNVYLPYVVSTDATAAKIEVSKRPLWISADSSCKAQRDLDVFGIRIRAIVPGSQPCDSRSSSESDITKQDDRAMIAKFGTQPPPFDPFKQEAPKETASNFRPVIWGLIGAAVMSGIVLSLQREEERKIPVSHRGW